VLNSYDGLGLIMTDALYYHYWGKASAEPETGPAYHLLPYHCLDVAAVADVWLSKSQSIWRSFMNMSGLDEKQSRAWLLFFIALHDYGKFDLRFQRKAQAAWKDVNPDLSVLQTPLSGLVIKEYNHGPAGLYWFYQDLSERFSSGNEDFCFEDNDDWLAWSSWLAPVVGHHGIVPGDHKKDCQEYGLSYLQSEIKQARLQWLHALEFMFLLPADLSLAGAPPVLDKTKT
jgi:CRISPR-associated endonuclease/helicase Cas3